MRVARLSTGPGSRRQPPAGCASSSASATQRLSFFGSAGSRLSAPNASLTRSQRSTGLISGCIARASTESPTSRVSQGVRTTRYWPSGRSAASASRTASTVAHGADRDRDLPALVLEAELRLSAPLGRGAQEEHRVLRVGAPAGEGAAQLMLDDRPVGDELHQDSTIRQAISNSASGCSSAASQISLDERGYVPGTDTLTGRHRRATGGGIGSWVSDGTGVWRHRTGDRGTGGPGAGVRLLRPLPEQGDRLVAGLAQRGGKGDLVLIAAGGLAERRDDEAPGRRRPPAAARSSSTCQFTWRSAVVSRSALSRCA